MTFKIDWKDHELEQLISENADVINNYINTNMPKSPKFPPSSMTGLEQYFMVGNYQDLTKDIIKYPMSYTFIHKF